MVSPRSISRVLLYEEELRSCSLADIREERLHSTQHSISSFSCIILFVQAKAR